MARGDTARGGRGPSDRVPGDTGPDDDQGSGDPPVALDLLGGFELRIDGEVRSLPPTCQRLLAHLAMCRGGQSRARIAGVLWPTSDERRASANLRGVIWRLPAEVRAGITATGTALRVHVGWDIDLARCHALAAQMPSDTGELAEAVELLSADLLPGWYDDWLVAEQERHRAFRLNTLETLARQRLSLADLGTAVDLALSLVGADPLRESAQETLITAYLEQGNRAMAIRQFERFRDDLQRALGVAPSPHLSSILIDIDRPRRTSVATTT